MTDLRVRLQEDTLPIREVEGSELKRGRLVDRADNFGQSRGRFNIDRIVSTELRREFYAADWFHTIVNTKTHRVVCIVMAFYIGLFLLFALFYMAVVNFNAKCIPGARGYIRGNQSFPEPFPGDDDPDSHVGPVTFDTFIRVCFFSVQTMMTIGYGADDVFFGNCPSMLVLITMQSITGVFASSILFGLMLKRLVRASSRAQTIVFSENAIVRASATDDELYLVIRVAEMRSHQLCQAYVHAYAMCDTTDVIGDTAAASEGAAVHALPMTLTHPTGEMLLVTPCFILHRLDVRSPLLPPELDPMHTRPPADWYDIPQLLRALQAMPHEVVRPARGVENGNGSLVAIKPLRRSQAAAATGSVAAAAAAAAAARQLGSPSVTRPVVTRSVTWPVAIRSVIQRLALAYGRHVARAARSLRRSPSRRRHCRHARLKRRVGMRSSRASRQPPERRPTRRRPRWRRGMRLLRPRLPRG